MQSILTALFIALVVFIILLFASFCYSFINNLKLIIYLKHNKYSTWQSITTIVETGSGGANPIKILKYIYSNHDDKDDVILKLKNNIKTGLKYSFFIFIALLVELSLFAYFEGREP